MMYEMQSRIRYSEAGLDQRLTKTGLVNYFQDCCIFHSEDAGLGIELQKERNRAWVLSSWQIDIKEMPVLGEKVRIRTWAYGFKGFIGYRNFTMTDEKEHMFAWANSIWTMVDAQKRRPARITPQDTECYGLDEKLDMEYEPRRIDIEGQGRPADMILAGRDRMDTNGHMNNAQYIAIAEEYLPEGMQVSRIRAEYKKEVRPGDRIQPVIYEGENRMAVVLGGTEQEGAVYAAVEFQA